MEVPLIVLFCLGVVLGIWAGVGKPITPPSQGTQSKPDLLDDMILWGEVNNYDDYRM